MNPSQNTQQKHHEFKETCRLGSAMLVASPHHPPYFLQKPSSSIYLLQKDLSAINNSNQVGPNATGLKLMGLSWSNELAKPRSKLKAAQREIIYSCLNPQLPDGCSRTKNKDGLAVRMKRKQIALEGKELVHTVDQGFLDTKTC